MSKYHVREAEEFLREKGENITREECFALYGYINALYICKELSVKEYMELLEKIPVPTEELEAVVL